MSLIKAILPAAGLGTRFLPATKAAPKEMLPIVDKPLIQYAVEEAKKCGITDFIIITGKNKRSIEDHFDIAFELEETLKQQHKDRLLKQINTLKKLNFAFIRQGKALGLGHAVLCAKPFIGDEPFAVLLSDDIVGKDENLLQELINIHKEKNAPVIALEEVSPSQVSQYGIIAGDEIKPGLFKIKSLVEKPEPAEALSNLAIIGRYILTPDIFPVLEKTSEGWDNEIQLTDALNTLATKGELYGYRFSGERYDAGDKLGFIKAIIDLSLKRAEFAKPIKEHIQLLVRHFESE